MSMLDKIIEDVKTHALKCDSPKIFIRHDHNSLNKIIRCECGYECELPFSAALESAPSKQAYLDFETALDLFNSPQFLKHRKEIIKKAKEEEARSKELEKRKNAIGSLEV